jgi:hypothetical protein
MAAFCSRCGAPVSGAFCGKCGAAQAAPAAPGPAPSPAPAAAPGSPLVKIVLIVVGVFMLLGVLAMAGLFYAGYKVKQKVEETAAEKGINLRDLASQARASSADAPARDGCPLLPKDEAQQIVGIPISRMDGTPGTGDNREHCDYFGSAAEVAERGQQEMEKAIETAKAAKSSDNPQDAVKFGEALIKGLGANAKAAQSGETQIFRFHVLRGRGRSQIAIIKTSLTAVAGQFSGLTKVEGVGDEALLGPMNVSMYVRKGDDFVEIELGSLPGSKEKGIELARSIVSRL